MEQRKPRIGVLLFTSGWFRDVGLQDPASDVTAEVESIAAQVIERLSAYIEPVTGGVIFSQPDAEKAARDLDSRSVQGLILAPLMWCEDEIARSALKLLPMLPVVLCTFLPYRTLSPRVDFQEMIKGSGSVGTLQMSGFLHREGYRYVSAVGYYDDPSLYEEIADHCRALSVASALRHIRCGVLPFRCEQMSTTYVDEFELRRRYGVELKYLEIAALEREAHSSTEEEVDQLEATLRSEGYGIEIDAHNVREGIRYALALDKITAREDLQILAMNDVIEEMHGTLGLRPCLGHPEMSKRGVVVSMEADVAAGVAMKILQLFTGQAPFYTEIFTADLEKNALLMGHAGCHDPVNHDPAHGVHVVSDIEYENTDPFTGACIYFKYRSGPVTVVNSVYTDGKLRWSVFEGESLPGPPKMNGNCHLFCSVDLQIPELYRRILEAGVSQHFIVVAGHLRMKLRGLCSWLDIGFLDMH
jgi:L-arabinose isomerase